MREKPDHYTDQAKQQGYLARSVFKLEELDRRFGLLKHAGAVLDLGAAPGSWTQYVLRTRPEARVVAVDLAPIRLPEETANLTVINDDIFRPELIEDLRRLGPFELVLSDAAPATTGNRGLDAARSASLAEMVVEIARHTLAEHGTLVAKIFQGGDERELLKQLRSEFRSARACKPRACRKDSVETYLLASRRH